jgi:hypothetical protein
VSHSRAALIRGRTLARLLDKARLHGRHGLREMNPLVEQRQFTEASLANLVDEIVVRANFKHCFQATSCAGAIVCCALGCRVAASPLESGIAVAPLFCALTKQSDVEKIGFAGVSAGGLRSTDHSWEEVGLAAGCKRTDRLARSSAITSRCGTSPRGRVGELPGLIIAVTFPDDRSQIGFSRRNPVGRLNTNVTHLSSIIKSLRGAWTR